jgi:zinc protease
MNAMRLQSILLSATLTLLSPARSQENPDRTVRPELGPTPRVELPTIQRAQLPGGLRLWLVEKHTEPIVAFNLVVFAGSERDPVGKAGLASLTSAMIQQGTPARTALQIADELDGLGARMSVIPQPDYTSASLMCLKKHLNAALAIYADILTHATIPEAEFARVKNERLTSLIQQRDRARTLANRVFERILYGGAHPYGNDVEGSDATLSGLTRDDVESFYQTYYRPNNATLVVVGDVTMPSLLPHLVRSFTDWKRAEIPPERDVPVPQAGTRKIVLVDKPGAPQSEIRIGYPALERSTPDYFPVSLMNLVLGGQFSSRLNSNIRERRGFSYGVRSAFQFTRLPGPFVASGGVQSAKTDSALGEFIREIDLMHDKGLTMEELVFAKHRTDGTFATSFETPAQIASALINNVAYHLPDDYIATYLQNVDAVSLEDVQRVAKKYLDSSKMSIVIVGDVATIREGIERMHLGPISLADANGNAAQ